MIKFYFSFILSMLSITFLGAANPTGDLRLEVISAYNFVVDSNDPTSGPTSAYVGVEVCNDGADDLSNVVVNIGDFTGPTPGVYPTNTVSYSRYSGTFSFEHSGECDVTDASRTIGIIPAGECVTQYWLLEYPVVDGSGDPTIGGNSTDDDLTLDFDFWATATDPVDGVLAADDSWTVTLRSMISAMANKSQPNGTNKVPAEYLNAFEQELGWRPDTENASAGSEFVLEGIWYDLGRINKGYDNDRDFIPDYNVFMQPVGNPSQFDACCYKLTKAYGLIIVKLTDGTEHLIPFEDQLYFSNIPDNNNGAVGLVFYEFLPVSAPCAAALTPYQCVASGKDNEKYNGDYGAGSGVPGATAPDLTFDKSGPVTSSTAPPTNLTYTLSVTNNEAEPVGLPQFYKPLVISDAIPTGTEYISGTAALTGTPTATINYSTDNGVTWVTTEPVPASSVTNIQWWLDDVLGAGATVTANFNVSIPSYTIPVIENEGGVGFGGDTPLLTDIVSTIVLGVNSIGDIVFADDGGTTGTTGNGVQDGDEAGIPDIGLTLYLDSNGDGSLDANDILLSTSNTDASGNYTFTDLPDGDFLVVVDNQDPDLNTGWGISSGTSIIAVNLSGGNNLDVDFGFSPAIEVTKTLTSPAPAYENQYVNYDLEIENLIGPPASTGTPPTTEVITAWATAGTNSGFTNPGNAYDDGTGANGTYASGGSNTTLDFSTFSNLTGIPNPSSTITKVEAGLTFYMTGTVPGSNEDLLLIAPIKGGSVGSTSSISLASYDDGNTHTIYVDITANSTGLVDWALLTAADRGLRINYDRVGSNDGVTLHLDAVSYRVTHTIPGTPGDGGYSQSTCGDSPMAISSPTSLTMLDDEVSNAISLAGFNFDYFGTAVTQAYISSNGFLSFTSPGTDGVTTPALTTFPDANFEKTIAFCFTDLDPSLGGTIEYGYDADGSVFLVNFTNIQHFGGGNPITTQLQLHEGTNEVKIITTSQPDGVASHLMGLQDDVLSVYSATGRNYTTWTATNECLSFSSSTSGTFNSTTSLSPVPLKDTWNAAQMCFVEASITPDSVNNTTGELFWDDIGIINGKETKTINVTFEAKEPTAGGEALNNTASVTGATFVNGIAANDDSSIASTTLENTGSIGDLITNSNSGLGIPGVTVNLVADVDLILDGVTYLSGATITTTTDASGNYLFDGLLDGNYTVTVDPNSIPGTVVQTGDPDEGGTCSTCDNSTIVAVSSSNDHLTADFAYAVPNAISGNIWNDNSGEGTQEVGENGMGGVTVYLSNGACTIGVDCPTTTTDLNGNYTFGDLADGTYSVVVDNVNSPGTGYTNTLDPEGTISPNNSSDPIAVSGGNIYSGNDFGYNETGSSTIGDVLFVDWDGDGTQDAGVDEGISGVTINLYEDSNGDGIIDASTDALIASTTTGTNGSYSFGSLPAGDYIVDVDESTLPEGVANQTSDPDETGICTTCDAISSVAGVDGTTSYNDEDFGYAPFGTGSIGDIVYTDSNGDGIHDNTESGIANIDVILYADLDGDGNYTPIDTVITDTNGNYLFDNLPDGDYQVLIDPAETNVPQDAYGNDAITTTPSTADVVISGGSISAINGTACSSCNLNVDFGYAYPAAIGNTIFYDNNANGTQDLSEEGISGVTVYLCDTSTPTCNATTAIATEVTDSDGAYLFNGLDPGEYNVVVDASTLPSGVSPSADPNSDGLACSDPDLVAFGYDACDNMADSISVNFGSQMTGIDFGYEPSSVIGDQVWFDVNGDGIYDSGEPIMSFVDVIITPPAGVDLGNGIGIPDTVTTDSDGFWSYANLSDGAYSLELDMTTVAAGYTAGYDADGGDDSTTSFTISSGSVTDGANSWCNDVAGCDSDLDFAVELSGSNTISGTICLDDGSDDGVCSTGGESMLDGTTVYLYNDEGTFMGSTTVDVNGNYSFSGLPDDTYNVVVGTTSTPLDLTAPTTDAADTPASSVTNTGTSFYQTVTVSGADINALDFAFQINIDIDFGDLPGPYPTALTDGPVGAYHILETSTNLFLGSFVDAETSPTRSLTASGDNANGTNDEDGIIFNNTAAWTIGNNGGNIDLTIDGTNPNGYLVAWIDFNEDGDFSDVGEMILDSLMLNGTHIALAFDIPSGTDLTAGNTLYARFRIFEERPAFPQFAYSGEATNGEVEDYRIIIDQITNTTLPVDDDNSTLANVSVNGNVLTNDLDPQGDNLTFSGFDNPSDFGNYVTNGNLTTIPGIDTNGNPIVDAGDLTINPDGSYSFTPTTDFVGEVEIAYLLCDDGTPQVCENATLTITVSPIPDPNDDTTNSLIANNDDNITYDNVNIDGDVLSNDRDPDGDNLAFSGFEDPNNSGTYDQISSTLADINGLDDNGLPVTNAGDLIIGADGTYTFDPEPGFTGTVDIDYQVCDDASPSNCTIATLSITVLGDANVTDNDPPFAGDDYSVTVQSTPVTGAWLSNDNDPNSDNITINGSASNVDPDSPGDGSVTLVTLSTDQGGTVQVYNDGTYLYTPPIGYSGPDEVSYEICDVTATAPQPLCDSATIHLLVTPINNTFAVDDENVTLQDVEVTGNVMTNDFDPESDDQTFSSFLDPSTGLPTTSSTDPITVSGEGTLTPDGNGGYTFDPDPSFTGVFSIEYEVCDDGIPQTCETATLEIEVAPTPDPTSTSSNDIIANNDDNVTYVNKTVSGGLLSNDSDPESDNITFVGFDDGGAPTNYINNGTLSSLPGTDADGNVVADAGDLNINADGTYTFVPAIDFVGKVQAQYQICDDSTPQACEIAVLTIKVLPDEDPTNNDPPFAGDDFLSTPIGTTATDNFINNDNDVNSNSISVGGTTIDPNDVTPSTIGTYTTDQGGSITMYSDGNYTYAPPASYSGPDSYAYEICDVTAIDPQPLCDSATINLLVVPLYRDFSDLDNTLYSPASHQSAPDGNSDNIPDGANAYWLGTIVDYESVDVSSGSATGDDNDAVDDEDGLIIPASLSAGTNAVFTVTVNSNTTGKTVHFGLWIDWNEDGTFDSLYVDSGITSSPTNVNVTIPVPVTYSGGTVNIRLRAFDTAPTSADSSGDFKNGEVEDYQRSFALPVELIDFKAQADKCDINLNWVSASEDNFSHYEVERSKDGYSFNTINTVEAKGGSSSLSSYQFTDYTAFLEGYYRLKMVDLDGTFEYSQILVVNTDCDDRSNISVFPNPVLTQQGILNVRFFSNQRNTSLKLVDMLGKTVKILSLSVETDVINTLQLDISDIPGGSYSLKIGNEDSILLVIID